MKEYVKPDLYYENFELNQSVATCQFDINSTPEQGCVATLDPSFWGQEITIFTQFPTCEFEASSIRDADNMEIYCYTVAVEGSFCLFNS